MFQFYNITANAGNPPDGISTFHLRNASVSLFYRDARYWESDTYWSRGNGWAIAAMARSLERLPKDAKFDQQRAEYEGKLLMLAKTLKGLQGSDGAWRASLLEPSRFPSPETTGTANFAYAIAYGLNTGMLSKEEFAPVL